MNDVPLQPISIDVGQLLQGSSVASLYAYLVTRPTGRAVRMAIETQLQGVGTPSLTLVDLSEVLILDFSCADEVVAKLIQDHLVHPVRDAFFVFRGVHEPHRDQIEAVLERHGLATVAEVETGRFALVGVHSEAEARAWAVLEERGFLDPAEADELLGEGVGRPTLVSLCERRLAFPIVDSGRVHALSRLVSHLL